MKTARCMVGRFLVGVSETGRTISRNMRTDLSREG